MLEVGWSEMLVIAIVMIVVVGPKDLPKMLRTFGRTTTKLRQMAGDFQKQFNDALQEAELDEVKKSVDALRGLNPTAEIKKQLNPFEKAAADVRAGLQSLNPASPPNSTPTEPAVAEPVKSGSTAANSASSPETPAASGAAAKVTSKTVAKPAASKVTAKAKAPAKAKASKAKA